MLFLGIEELKGWFLKIMTDNENIENLSQITQPEGPANEIGEHSQALPEGSGP